MQLIRVGHLQGIQEDDNFAGVLAAVDVVAEEEVITGRRIAFQFEDAEKNVDIPVDITDNDVFPVEGQSALGRPEEPCRVFDNAMNGFDIEPQWVMR
jgi:hypothetical protein